MESPPELEFNSAMGVLEVLLHEARAIQNICIYHKQDVYAELSLTSDPEKKFSTKTINGGGRNPVFNETLSLPVKTLESSLKCEVFMMSRVKNYLEDQFLGFTTIPLFQILVNNNKLEKEFPLSSTDLFESPAGFLRLTIKYDGEWPEILHLPIAHREEEVPDDLTQIEMMASCLEIEESELGTECESEEVSEMGVRLVESFSGTDPERREGEMPIRLGEVEEENVVVEDIVEKYKKSVQQFSEPLGKMKLVFDNHTGAACTGSENKLDFRNKSKVFYGSRAFF